MDNNIVSTIRETIRQKDIDDANGGKTSYVVKTKKQVDFQKVEIKMCMNWKEVMTDEEKQTYWYQGEDLADFEEDYKREVGLKRKEKEKQIQIQQQKDKQTQRASTTSAAASTTKKSARRRRSANTMAAFARGFGIGNKNKGRQQQQENKFKLAPMTPEQMSHKSLKELNFFLEHNKWVDMETLQTKPFTKVKMTPGDTRAARVLIANHFKKTPSHWKKEEEDRLEKEGRDSKENIYDREDNQTNETLLEDVVSLTSSLTRLNVGKNYNVDNEVENGTSLSDSLVLRHLSKNKKSWKY